MRFFPGCGRFRRRGWLVSTLWGAGRSRPRRASHVRRLVTAVQPLESRLAFASAPSLVLDINALPVGADPAEFVVAGNVAYFAATNAGQGRELWRTDGTVAGTSLVADIEPGATGSDPAGLTLLGSTLFFAATRGGDRELWKSDGTAAGTRLVKNISDYDSNPEHLVAVGDTLFFAAWSSQGNELWKSDGTEAGTKLVKDLDPSVDYNWYGEYAASGYPRDLTAFRGRVFFSAGAGEGSWDRVLWTSDGTESGTVIVGAGVAEPSGLAVSGDRLFLAGREADTPALWVSDGTPEGTVPLAGGWSGIADNAITGIVPFAGGVLFSGDHGEGGHEPWYSDGTAEGTTRVADIDANGGSLPSGFTVVGGKAYFAADDGLHGRELWMTDGTAAGTSMVRDIRSGAADGFPTGSASFASLANLNGRLLFGADEGEGSQLWASDGTADGTAVLKRFDLETRDAFDGSGAGSASFVSQAILDGFIYFPADDGIHGTELWKTDGTAAGTRLVADVTEGATGSTIDIVGVGGGKLFFSAYAGPSTWEPGDVGIYATDGGAENPTLVGTGRYSDFAMLGGVLFMREYDGRIVRTDGTPQGTFLVADSASSGGHLGAVGDRVFFEVSVGGSDPSTRSLMIRSTDASGDVRDVVLPGDPLLEAGVDGLFEAFGTLCVTQLAWQASTLLKLDGSGGISAVTAVDYSIERARAVVGGLLFHALDDDGTLEIRTSDGTPAGTQVLASFANNSNDGWVWIDSMHPWRSGVVFTLGRSGVGNAPTRRELWYSDGSPAGTVAIVDGIEAFEGVAGGKLVYRATDAEGVGRLFLTDGTPAGTSPLPAVSPRRDSDPGLLGVLGNRLLLSATDDTHGRELFSASLATVPDAPTGLAATRGDGRVTLSWKAPGSDGGAAIGDYRIERSSDGGGTWTTVADGPSTATTATVTGLVNGTSYVFRVAAINAVGAGNFTANSVAVVPGRVASAPLPPAVTRGDGRVTLSWQAPASDGGLPITDYVIRWSTDQGVTWNTFAHPASSATSITVTGLANGKSHVFRVAAVTAVGRGFLSGDSVAVVPATLPDAPTALGITRKIDEAVLSWQAPASNGGTAITDYAILWSDDDGLTWKTHARPATTSTTATIKGLSSAAPFRFRVAAVNAVGTGGFVEVASAGSPA